MQDGERLVVRSFVVRLLGLGYGEGARSPQALPVLILGPVAPVVPPALPC